MSEPIHTQITESRNSRREFGLHTLYRWNTEFTERRNATVESENVSHVEDRRKLGVTGRYNDIRLFMEAGEDKDTWSPQARLIVEFYEAAISTNGPPNLTIGSQEKVALIDDRDEAGRPRMTRHALSPAELLERLKQLVSIRLIHNALCLDIRIGKLTRNSVSALEPRRASQERQPWTQTNSRKKKNVKMIVMML